MEISGMLSDLLIYSRDKQASRIAGKVLDYQRISQKEGNWLFEKAEPGFLGILATYVRQRWHGDNAYYIRNFHIEPSNICVNHCSFCSFSHHFSREKWVLSADEMLEKVRLEDQTTRELHITGAVHPERDLSFYGNLLEKIKEIRPDLHLKAYSAVELDVMIRKSGMSYSEGLRYLKSCGLNSIPGGGAEIFKEDIRHQICGMKTSSADWLKIHETAHKLGLPSNATILYGHIEKYNDRIDHLERLRQLQDRTGGFNAFIPLKFHHGHNAMSEIQETSVVEDMKMYAVSRIYLDNFPHLKAYWPALGKQFSQLSLSFGVDDMDGTIQDSTKIYALAGAEEQNPQMTVSGMRNLILESARIPVERDALYQPV